MNYDKHNATTTENLNPKDLSIIRLLGANLGCSVTYKELVQNKEISKTVPLNTIALNTLQTKLVSTRIRQEDHTFHTNAVLLEICITQLGEEKIYIEI